MADYSPWGHKESDTAEQRKHNTHTYKVYSYFSSNWAFIPYFVIIFVIEITNTFHITGEKRYIFHLFLHQALGVSVCMCISVLEKENRGEGDEEEENEEAGRFVDGCVLETAFPGHHFISFHGI